jgi:mannosyl-oligosaccharide glucosidase
VCVTADFRHTCEQHEGMAGYGWEEYDIRNGGRQVIHDAGNGLDLTIDFIKVPGGHHGGNWAARIKGALREDTSPHAVTTVVFYAGMEGFGSFEFKNEPQDLGHEGAVILEGQTADLGDFDITITPGPDNSSPARSHESWDQKPLDRTLAASAQVPVDAMWMAKNAVFSVMKPEVDALVDQYGQENLPPPWQIFTIPNNIRDGNFHMVQKVFQGPFEFDILFNSRSAPKPLTSEDLSEAIATASQSFKKKFTSIFAPKSPFDAPKYTTYSQAMLSNLVGGIGYFYGDSLVDRSYAPAYEEQNEGFWEETAAAQAEAQISREGPAELFTSVPSRPFFPRGFLWDEGFHLIPIAEWDMDLTLEIVQSWFNLMDEDGWIAREQILGAEARSKVPQEFQVQYPHYANPPTLFMILESFVDKLNAEQYDNAHASKLKDHIRKFYPLLKRQYFWFRKTQWGDLKSYDRDAFSSKEAYRWRGRTVRHILTSGIDDYPRPQPPHPGELHTDLISWVGMMTRSLRRLAESLDEGEDATEFKGYERAIIRNIDDLHWSSVNQTFCDATIDDYEESVHVCHKGYVSIFPFMTGLLPADSPRLKPILDLISDPKELWSDYGIRSLSQTDEFYGTDENYWRGPIWINMNYLILKNLLVSNLHFCFLLTCWRSYSFSEQDVATTKGPHQKQAREIYTKLRINVVENVFHEWEKTGFAWEQYSPETGAGQRTQHFTGWTSLVVNMMVMPDLSKSGISHSEL